MQVQLFKPSHKAHAVNPFCRPVAGKVLYQTSPLLTRTSLQDTKLTIHWSVQVENEGLYGVFAYYDFLSTSDDLFEPCRWEASFRYLAAAKQYCKSRFKHLAALLEKERLAQKDRKALC